MVIFTVQQGPALGLVNGVFNSFVSGWQLTGIYTAQSGTPIFLSTATNLTNSYVPFSRPNNNGQSAALSGSAQSRLNEWFNTSVFSQPPAFTFGTAGRTLPNVRDDGINNLDLGVFKNNRFGRDGRFNLQLRGEFFNVANRTRFLDPGLVYKHLPQFGVVSAQAQFAAANSDCFEVDFLGYFGTRSSPPGRRRLSRFLSAPVQISTAAGHRHAPVTDGSMEVALARRSVGHLTGRVHLRERRTTTSPTIALRALFGNSGATC